MTRELAFTLIELSIVLVIIGLIVGGVLVGRDLIKSAEMRSLVAAKDRYQTAYNTFRGKYNCIAGDCINATDFFGAQDPTPATCQTTSSTGTLTCNGNGNGQVEDNTYEVFRFWQQLAIAGMVEGKYTGVAGSAGTYHHVLGVNAPATSLNLVGFSFSYLNTTGDSATYGMNYGNAFWIGQVLANSNLRPQRAFLRPADAMAFDKKIDDGMPGTGIAIMRQTTYGFGDPLSCTTSTSNADFTGVYNIATNNIVCAFMIKTNDY